MSGTSSSAASLVQMALDQSGLTQAELARRAGISRSVLNAYLKGHREPGADALLRIVSSAGGKLELGEHKPPVDPVRAGRILMQVLGLAEALPYRPRAEMRYPRLADRLAPAGRR
jgi:transcriptional regulator with XRE-family HTH domain